MGCGRRVGGDPRAGGAGRPGVSAHLLMAGIWGVIERGGRPGARVGLHEQLNVIRPRPSGSSWVIDNPAAFLPGPRHQTGSRRRAGQRGPRAGTGPSSPGSALLARDAHRSGEKPRRDLPSSFSGGSREGRGGEGTRWRGARSAGAQPREERGQSELSESGTKSLEPGKKAWEPSARRGGNR